MTYQVEIDEAVTSHRKWANDLLETQATPLGDTATLALHMQAGFDGIRDALLVISRQIDEVAGKTAV